MPEKLQDWAERYNYKQQLEEQGYSKSEAEKIVKANPQSTAKRVSRERSAHIESKWKRKSRSKN